MAFAASFKIFIQQTLLSRPDCIPLQERMCEVKRTIMRLSLFSQGMMLATAARSLLRLAILNDRLFLSSLIVPDVLQAS